VRRRGYLEAVIDIVTVLETDHRIVERLLEQLATSDPGPDRERDAGRLADSLALHLEFEEREVYPLLAPADEELVTEADVEHQLARTALAQVGDLVAAPGFGAAVEMLKAVIGHHVSEEESEAFPELRELCPSDRLEELGLRLVGEKRERGVIEAELDFLNKSQLDELARLADVDGRSSMSIDELRVAVSGH